jgi:NADPH:quinone reductase-like Zn-dependent oxidoreductase
VAPATSEALWYAAPGRAEIRSQRLDALRPDGVRVRSLFSAVSRGTERLVFSGRVPPSEFERMRAPFMEGAFPFPVKYGYASVGTVEHGGLAGKTVFALHPHQTLFDLPADAVTPLPDGVSPRRAVLAANMETALNATWDAELSSGGRIAIVGAGVVGTLVAFLCRAMPNTAATLIDIDPSRAQIADALDIAFTAPDKAPENCDVVFHTSATAAGLATALRVAGFEARIVELSWYGDGDVPVPLGGAFHSRRLKLISSQVGTIAPSHRADWNHRRRLSKALELLADPRLDSLLSPAIDFHALPARLPDIFSAGGASCPLVQYPEP